MTDYQYDGNARAAAVARAERWTREQAERLGYTSDEILAAIRERAWLPEEVEALAVAYADHLERSPPRVRAVADRLRRAPVMPVVRDTEIRSRRRESFVGRPSPYRMAAE